LDFLGEATGCSLP